MRRRPRLISLPQYAGWLIWVNTIGALAMTTVALVIATASSCAHVPPHLGPAGALAWKQHEIQKDLDLIRDLAQDANAQSPPLVSTAGARIVTLWHKTAITLVHDASQGWQATVLKGLADLRLNLPAAEYRIIAPYIAVAASVVRSVQP